MEEGSLRLNPQVKRVIQSYQNSAVRSLSGPNCLPLETEKLEFTGNKNSTNCIAAHKFLKCLEYTKESSTQQQIVGRDQPVSSSGAVLTSPILQTPIFAPADSASSEHLDTDLEGETIACFTVGGEKRLCLPQILNTVLRNFTLQQINTVCDQLHIFCSRCNPKQLETLKSLKILPSCAPSCGLITKTDAERLCSALLDGNTETSNEPPLSNCFEVYHQCFGKARGVFSLDAYTSPESRCIRCVDCHGMFSPPKFVCHSHKSLEFRTCHWGFDSANWRCYLMIAKDVNWPNQHRLLEALEEAKQKFHTACRRKRKQNTTEALDDLENKSKQCKTESIAESSPSTSSCVAWEPIVSAQVSDCPKWSNTPFTSVQDTAAIPQSDVVRDELNGLLPPYLHAGPPVLLNPERVVPFSECEMYEQHFTPNVSLAPLLTHNSSSPGGEAKSCNQSPMSEASLTKLESQDLASPAGRRQTPSTQDYDLPTDTDDSSLASPTESIEDLNVTDVPLYKSTLEQEMNMIRSVLEGKIDGTPEAHHQFLREYSKMRARAEEMIHWFVHGITTLKHKLEVVRRQNLELDKLVSTMEAEKGNLVRDEQLAIEKVMSLTLQSRKQARANQDLGQRIVTMESAIRLARDKNLGLVDQLVAMSKEPMETKKCASLMATPKSSCPARGNLDISKGGDQEQKYRTTCLNVGQNRNLGIDEFD